MTVTVTVTTVTVTTATLTMMMTTIDATRSDDGACHTQLNVKLVQFVISTVNDDESSNEANEVIEEEEEVEAH